MESMIKYWTTFKLEDIVAKVTEVEMKWIREAIVATPHGTKSARKFDRLIKTEGVTLTKLKDNPNHFIFWKKEGPIAFMDLAVSS